MAPLTRAAQAKLAEEIRQSAPPPEWNTISALKKFKEDVKAGKNTKTMTFDELVVREKELSSEIEYRKYQLDQVREHLLAGMLVSDKEKVTCEGYDVLLVTKSGSKKLDRDLLVKAGVDADTIAACTVQGTGSQYVQVKASKEK